MALINSWIANIILLILFATILELMLPNSSTHRYVKLVIGLMILVAMLQPVISIFQEDPEKVLEELVQFETGVEEDQSILKELEKTDIESESLAYISEKVAVQLKADAETFMLEEFDKQIVSIEVSFEALHATEETDNLNNLHVILEDSQKIQVDEESKNNEIHVERIEIKRDSESFETEAAEEELEGQIQMIDRLSEIWQVPVEKITIQDKGESLVD
ncbi:stage III sporulation protein AF [Salipaludibacillus neizhouensis]|uniref:stage III sporulation protein AF n=1 Tax=Salipaludibacillus neizhouensis TaxID=885475 RepID=UPI0016012F08|nr:stage III sporulation protein AF [Salipaludibacillus neizhouensis]